MRINVGVFFGGISVEHEISVISASQAMSAMDAEKYNIIPVYISKSGIFYTGPELMDVKNYSDMNKLLAKCQRINIINDNNEPVMVKYPGGKFSNNMVGKIDVAFPVVHGTNVEDGTLQGYLEMLRIPYVGSDILGSAMGMDKVIMKKVLRESGIPTVDYVSFYSKDWYKDNAAILAKIANDIQFPVIVKPANLGSSVGIKKVNHINELEEAVFLAQTFSKKILIEKMIKHLKEINCSVLGDYEKTEASVCEEPISSDEILSYKDKYLNKGGSKGMSATNKKLPADIPEEQARLIKSLAMATFKTLGCSGVARVDFLIDQDINQVYVNEINTIPGSLSFYLWEATGKPFPQLIDDLISLALKRERERKSIVFSYDINILALKGKGK
jgi:D-alanine-D-alanine ligase